MMFKENSRTWDFPAAACLTLIVFLSSYALELTYWTYNLNRVTSLALLGLLTGFFIGRSSFSLSFSRVLMGLYCAAFFIIQFIVTLNNDPAWLFRVNQYGERVRSTLIQLSRNIPLEDGILFLTGAGFLYLISGMMLGFRLTRSRTLWPPFVLICGFFYITQFYLPEFQRNYFFIAIFTILVIFFIGRQTYIKRLLIWREKQIKMDPAVSGFFSRSILLITIVMGFISWGIPTAGKYFDEQAQTADLTWRQRNSDSWEVLRNFFYPLRQQTGFGEGYYPEILSLGTSRNLKDDEVFIVNMKDEYSYSGRYYWKGRVYDTYENATWKNIDTELSDTLSFDFFQQPLPNFESIIFNILYLYPREVVFTPQHVLEIDRNANILVNPISDQQAEVVSLVDYALVRTGESVKILGGFNAASLHALEIEEGNYPSWIIERYLQLPDDLPPEIRQLAEDLTANRKTKIDKALEIIDYLRNSFRYKNFVDIPQGEDPITWFLFSGREGFCNYYSTSAALLLRSVGIPARIAVGYAQGERIGSTNNFSVSIADSHSWVEVYFNGLGWVILEPTPSQPSVVFAAEVSNENDLNRLETLFLQPPDEEENKGRIKEFIQISKKYTAEVGLVKSTNQFSQMIWLIFIAILGVGLVITGMIYLTFLRQDSIQIPLMIERAHKAKNTVPVWIQRWSKFEKMTPAEKNFVRIRELSRLVIKQDPRLLTPKELFTELFKKTHYAISMELSDKYQRILFAPKDLEETKIDPNNYRQLMRTIIKVWIKETFKYLKFRLDLGRFDNISS